MKIDENVNNFLKHFFLLLLFIGIAVLVSFLFYILGLPTLGVIAYVVIATAFPIYYTNKLYDRKEISKFVVIFTVFLYYIITITFFAMVYTIPCKDTNNCMYEFGQPTNLTFDRAFYFSTVTITTLGYGDIVPHGFFRQFIIPEVIMGLIYMGIIIFFFTKK